MLSTAAAFNKSVLKNSLYNLILLDFKIRDTNTTSLIIP